MKEKNIVTLSRCEYSNIIHQLPLPQIWCTLALLWEDLDVALRWHLAIVKKMDPSVHDKRP